MRTLSAKAGKGCLRRIAPNGVVVVASSRPGKFNPTAHANRNRTKRIIAETQNSKGRRYSPGVVAMAHNALRVGTDLGAQA